MRARMNAVSATWFKVSFCSGFVFATGCGLTLDLGVGLMKLLNPDMVVGIVETGLIDKVPQAEIGTCGPTPDFAALIPDCPDPGLVCFTAACADHDLCYSTCGTSQKTCDARFFWDMVYLCDAATEDFWDRERCYNLAYIYYTAVQDYGAYYFANTQDYVCALGPAWPIPPVETDSQAAKMVIGSPFADMDGDLMPDDWELERGLNSQDSADAWLDYDQDSRVNLAEYTHGSDPFVPDSSVRH